jgi:signal peptidase I
VPRGRTHQPFNAILIYYYMVRLTLEQYDHKQEKEDNKKKGSPSFASSKGGFFLEIIKIVVITLAIILPIRYFLFQPFYVRGASMEQTFHDRDYLIIDEITYRLSDPKRGDVVVVRNPSNNAEFFIKRIIGLPREVIEFKNGSVLIFNDQYPDGEVLQEPYLMAGTPTTANEQRVTIADNQYFVMGDNRTVSLDSRIFGPLLRSSIVGRAWLRVWPFNTWQHFVPPLYQSLTTNTNAQ